MTAAGAAPGLPTGLYIVYLVFPVPGLVGYGAVRGGENRLDSSPAVGQLQVTHNPEMWCQGVKPEGKILLTAGNMTNLSKIQGISSMNLGSKMARSCLGLVWVQIFLF